MPYKDKKKQRAWQAAWAAKHGAVHLHKRRERNREFVIEYLQSHPCITCGESDILVLDFDHREQSTKDRTINHAIKDFGLDRLKKEIAKCDILCANCHRRRTAKQLGSYKLRKT